MARHFQAPRGRSRLLTEHKVCGRMEEAGDWREEWAAGRQVGGAGGEMSTHLNSLPMPFSILTVNQLARHLTR